MTHSDRSSPSYPLVRAAVASLLCLAVVQGAAAQETPAAVEEEELGEITVTGSRVSNGNSAPTPVTVVSAVELQATTPSSIADALNKVPQFKNSGTTSNQGLSSTIGNAGASLLDLRSLGSNRTLILLDGRRVAPSTAQGVTDISILPEELVERVDIVTGGASAVYGSDAVAGVVNFILDTDFTGWKTTVQGGISERGDGENGKVQLTGGVPFGENGHLLFSGSYYANDGVLRYGSRDWVDACARVTNPAGTPTTVVACGVNSSSFNAGGLVPSGPLRGTQFLEGGVPASFQYGSLVSSASMVGGSGIGMSPYDDVGAYYPPAASADRRTAFARYTHEFGATSVFVQGLYGRAQYEYEGGYPWQGNATGYRIQVDNAYLPESIRNRMIALGLTDFPLNRYDFDYGALNNVSTSKSAEFLAGLDRKIGTWDLTAHAKYARNLNFTTTDNNPIINRHYNAADAVVNPATGSIVCRSTLTQPGNGCVPLNLLGNGSPSQQALDWILGTIEQELVVKQKVAEFTLSGDLFELPAGPVAVATGGGWREESSDQTVDEISSSYKNFTGGYRGFPASLQGQLGGFDRGNPSPVAGSYDLWEVFGEAAVPLLRDVTLARTLDLNAAVRYTDYSTSGGVTSWKAGLTWSPLESVRLRVARSRDIRAANVRELFAGRQQGQANIVDPFQPVGSPNRTLPVFIANSGTPTLDPESADTTTIGAVFTPAWLPGFSAAIDFYDIDLKDAIGTLGGQATIDQCFLGAAELCSLVHRDGGGVLVSIDTPFLNISGRATRGVDFELGWRLTPAISLRLLGNYIDELSTTNPGAPSLQLAGQTGGGGGVPRFSGAFSLGYTLGALRFDVLERYISEGAIDRSILPTVLAPAENHVDDVFYTDLTATYSSADDRWQAFITVNNAFDKDPPPAPAAYFVFGTATGGGTNASLFDVLGRTYTAGLRYRFF